MSLIEVVCEGRLARIELRHAPLNILNIALLRELQAALEELAHMPELALLVIHSRQKAFSAGADIREHLPEQAAEMLHTFHQSLLCLLEFPLPSLALIEGAALGGGCELALCCDFRLMSESARLGQPEIQVGVFPPLACLLLPALLPRSLAWEAVLSGRPLPASECQRWGLANAVYPCADFSLRSQEFLAPFLRLSPAVLRLTKRALRSGVELRSAVSGLEQLYLGELMQHPDALEGLRAFLEKRPPLWTGDVPG